MEHISSNVPKRGDLDIICFTLSLTNAKSKAEGRDIDIKIHISWKSEAVTLNSAKIVNNNDDGLFD